MQKITVQIETDNAAFEDHPKGVNGEVARILRELADKIENGQEPESVRDINGAKVGTVEIS